MSRAARRGQRRRWRRLHRWLGLCLGAWFLLVGASGSVLVYREEIDAWLNPDLLVDRHTGPALTSEAILERAAEAFPLAHVERLHRPAAAGQPYRLLVRLAPHMQTDTTRAEAFFSAVSGELLGSRDADARGLSRRHTLATVYDFHRNILLGGFGANFVGTAGFLLLLSVASGLVAAWPRRRAGWRHLVGVKVRAGATRLLFDLHRSWGCVIAPLLLVATLTGGTLVYVNYVRELIGIFSPVAPFPVVPWRGMTLDDPLPFVAVERRVRSEFPQHEITEVHIPSKPTAGYLFYLARGDDVHRLGDTLVWVHPASGEVLLERSGRNRTGGESVLHWLLPLHSGNAFGDEGRIAMCVAGLSPLLLALTGMWIWLRKRASARIELKRRAAALQLQPASPVPEHGREWSAQ